MFIDKSGLAKSVYADLQRIRENAGVTKEILPLVLFESNIYSSKLSPLGISASDFKCGWVAQCDADGWPRSVVTKVFSENSEEAARRLFQAWVDASPLDLSESPPNPDRINAAVEGWRSAWAAKNASQFLSYYSPIYWHAEKDLSYSGWEKDREQNFASKSSINVEVSNLSISYPHPYEARAVFHQVYSSVPSYTDRGTKTLVLFRHKDGNWKIVKEAWKAD